jgi:hypothetical protein
MVDRAGWLGKESPKKALGVAVYQRRYFMLSAGSRPTLRYYKAPPQGSSPLAATGEIIIRGAVVQRSSASDRVLEVFEATSARRFRLQAEGSDEADAWITAIQVHSLICSLESAQWYARSGVSHPRVCYCWCRLPSIDPMRRQLLPLLLRHRLVHLQSSPHSFRLLGNDPARGA